MVYLGMIVIIIAILLFIVHEFFLIDNRLLINPNKNYRRTSLRLFIAAVSSLLIGLAIFVFGYSANNFDFEKYINFFEKFG